MPPAPPPHPQEFQDAEHLKLLVVFHHVLAALTFVFGSFPIIHVVIGWMFVSGKFAASTPPGGTPPPVSPGTVVSMRAMSLRSGPLPASTT